MKHPELASPPATKTDQDDDVVITGAGGLGADAKPGDGRVLVGRPDGSLQCGMAKGRNPQDMEKDLDGIKIYSRSRRPDGKMHIQVCGSPTGMLNVYEIPVSSLKEAERRGFRSFEGR